MGETRMHREAAITIDEDARLLDIAMQVPNLGEESRIRRIIYLNDITNVAQSARMKADFVANASHELRTPLSTMKAATETLLESSDRVSAHERRFLEVLVKNVQRLEELVQDLLDLNLVESSTLVLNNEVVAFADAFELIIRDQGYRLDEKNIQLFQDFQVRSICADRKLLHLVMVNLVDNAIKFVSPKTGEVRVRTLAQADKVVIEVQDNGIGIPEEDLERVFERFYQVDKARSEAKQTGDGIGAGDRQTCGDGDGRNDQNAQPTGSGDDCSRCIAANPFFGQSYDGWLIILTDKTALAFCLRFFILEWLGSVPRSLVARSVSSFDGSVIRLV